MNVTRWRTVSAVQGVLNIKLLSSAALGMNPNQLQRDISLRMTDTGVSQTPVSDKPIRPLSSM